MRIRRPALACLALLVTSCLVHADEKDDTLDAILKEIRSLSERVGRLEAQVRTLSTQHAVQSPQRYYRLPALSPSAPSIENKRAGTTPEEVIRMQGESPGLLLKGLHQRERLLRNRPFPPDAGSISPLPFR